MALTPIQSVEINVTLPDNNVKQFTLEAPNDEEEPFGFGFREIKQGGKYRDGDNFLQKGHSTYRFIAKFAYHSHNMDIRWLLVAESIELRFPPNFTISQYQSADVLLANEEAVRDYLAGLAVGDEQIENDGVVLEFTGRKSSKWDEIFEIAFDDLSEKFYQDYKTLVESDGGQIINDQKTRSMIEFLVNNGLNGVVVAPWAGVKLREDTGQFFVEKAYSMIPYNGGIYHHPDQTDQGSQPEQVGETWIFDGANDFLMADPSDHPVNFTFFVKIADQSNTAYAISCLKDFSFDGNNRWGMQRFSSPSDITRGFVLSQSSGWLILVDSNLFETNIWVIQDDSGEFYGDGSLEGSGSGDPINPSGYTEISIGSIIGGGDYFDGIFNGATGLVTTPLNAIQVTEFNGLV